MRPRGRGSIHAPQLQKLFLHLAWADAEVLPDANTDALQRSIPYVNSAGRAFTSTLEDILLHVALHGAYHRGQVSIFVRDGGGIPAPTDYIGFARGVPAATTHRDSPPA